jgi:hypothetical protein
MNYTGLTIFGKFRRALAASYDDGAIYRNADGLFAFHVGGPKNFLDNLLHIMTTSEKSDFLTEWVLYFSDTQVIDLCQSMTGDLNRVRIWAQESAEKILDGSESQSFLADLEADNFNEG